MRASFAFFATSTYKRQLALILQNLWPPLARSLKYRQARRVAYGDPPVLPLPAKCRTPPTKVLAFVASSFVAVAMELIN